MYLESIGIRELERAVLNLGFCRGDVIYENKKGKEKGLVQGEMTCFSFDSISYAHLRID